MEINAITLVTEDMGVSMAFWQVLGLEITYGGSQAPFTTLRFGENFVNLVHVESCDVEFWGRIVFHVRSPDDLWRRFSEAGYEAMSEPTDAPWGERYFHIKDPAGHELSFARRL